LNKRDLVIVALATFCLTSTLFMILPSRSAEPYNPWADVSGPTMGEPDGTINMRDINYEILRFNTFGDTAKNVTVTNWPLSTQETVFWQQSTGAYSELYNTSGFGHVHVLYDVSGLVAPENVTIRGYSEIHEPGGHAYYTTHFLIVVATSDNIEGSISFPAPAEFFGFHLTFASGTTASVNLAFYMTYA
jgi:hypothetical protein